MSKLPCPACRSDNLVEEVKSRILAQNRHVRLLYAGEVARTAIETTLKEMRLHAGSGPHGDAIAGWIDSWIAELENVHV